MDQGITGLVALLMLKKDFLPNLLYPLTICFGFLIITPIHQVTMLFLLWYQLLGLYVLSGQGHGDGDCG